ncbi:MAG: TIGR00730 family Rossman fold protein [Azospirillaceae bacterium]|nr:TIGR00730 family Rossman fold protein [Azospirillaceae bacterium]
MSGVASVCVYCGAASGIGEDYKRAAHALGSAIADRDWQLVYGGGRVGLMGIVADAALSRGGSVIGIIPSHIQRREVEHLGLSELHVVDSMHTRKRMMVERADAFVVLPGGLGTLDETFEILTWKQLGLHAKPIIIVDIGGYWRPLLAAIDHAQSQGFLQPGYHALFSVVEQIEDVFAVLERQPAPPRLADISRL